MTINDYNFTISCYKCGLVFIYFLLNPKISWGRRQSNDAFTDQARAGIRGRGRGRAVVKCAYLFFPGGDAGAAGHSRRQLPADRRALTPSSVPAFNVSLASASFGAKICVLVGDREQTEPDSKDVIALPCH